MTSTGEVKLTIEDLPQRADRARIIIKMVEDKRAHDSYVYDIRFYVPEGIEIHKNTSYCGRAKTFDQALSWARDRAESRMRQKRFSWVNAIEIAEQHPDGSVVTLDFITRSSLSLRQKPVTAESEKTNTGGKVELYTKNNIELYTEKGSDWWAKMEEQTVQAVREQENKDFMVIVDSYAAMEESDDEEIDINDPITPYVVRNVNIRLWTVNDSKKVWEAHLIDEGKSGCATCIARSPHLDVIFRETETAITRSIQEGYIHGNRLDVWFYDEDGNEPKFVKAYDLTAKAEEPVNGVLVDEEVHAEKAWWVPAGVNRGKYSATLALKGDHIHTPISKKTLLDKYYQDEAQCQPTDLVSLIPNF